MYYDSENNRVVLSCAPCLQCQYLVCMFTHADQSPASSGSHRHLLVYLHDISRNDEARIAKADTDMFDQESWKQFILGPKGRGHEAQKSTSMAFCTFVSAVFF